MSQEYIVTYWWTPPVAYGRKAEPVAAFQLRQLRLPRVGQVVTWELSSPMTAGQTPPTIMAYGRITAVVAVEQQPGLYVVRLARCLGGLDYDELCACVHVPCVGFHPDFGCVEGLLVGLDPRSDLAGIADPLFTPFLQEDAASEDEPEEAVIWVDWATVWPRATVSDPPVQPRQERPSVPRRQPASPATAPAARPPALPEDARRLLLELAMEHRQLPYHSLTTPFLWDGKTVLLAVLPTPQAARYLEQHLKTTPVRFEFSYRAQLSRRQDYDEVQGTITDPQSDDLGLYKKHSVFAFRVQHNSPLTCAFAGTLGSLVQLVEQTTLSVLLFALDEQQRHLYVGAVELPFPATAQSAARDAMRQAQDYAHNHRHAAAEWSQTAACRLLQQLGSDREAGWINAVFQCAYMRGGLAQGRIADLVTAVVAHIQPELSRREHIDGLGPKRLTRVRTLLEQHPAAAALLQEKLREAEVPPTPWEQTEACRLLRAHGALGENRVVTYIYKAVEHGFQCGEFVGLRAELEEIAKRQRRVPGIGQAGVDQLAELLGIPPERRAPPPPVTFRAEPRQLPCAGHGATGQAPFSLGYTDADRDAPPATLLVLTDRGRLACSCAECYAQRQQFGWEYAGRPQEVVAESELGFIHGSRPYEDVIVPLAGADAGKCFSADKKFWHSDPPTPIQVAEHTRRLRNPAIIARREQVAALVRQLPQAATEHDRASPDKSPLTTAQETRGAE